MTYHSELQQAVKHIKKKIRTLNYPMVILGSFVIGVISTLQVLAFHPQLINLGFIPSFKFALGMSGLTIFIIMVLIVVDGFYWAYIPMATRKILNYKNWFSATVKLLKNSPTITSEHLDRKEYNQKLFEQLLTDEKPTLWKWLAEIFVYIERKFKDYDKRFERLEKSSGVTKMHSCHHCNKPFELFSPDADFTTPMLKKCKVCDTLVLDKWIEWKQECKHCKGLNVMGWHDEKQHSLMEKGLAKLKSGVKKSESQE